MSEPVPGVPVSVSVGLDWNALDVVEPRHINQAVTQVGPPLPDGTPDGIYLGFGTALPPAAFLGLNEADEQVRRRVLADLQANPVKVVIHGRFHVSRGFLDAVIQVLQNAAKQYDAAAEYAASKTEGGS